MPRIQIFAYAVLAGLALYLLGSTLVRMHEGRCANRGRLDCSYPAAHAAPAWR